MLKLPIWRITLRTLAIVGSTLLVLKGIRLGAEMLLQ